MWGLGGKEASRDPQKRATLGFEGLSVFASWMARTAHDKPFHPPVLFSSFIWVRGAGDGWSCAVVVISRVSSGAGILFSQASAGHLPLLIALSLSPFPHRACTLGLWRGWVGEEQAFSSSLCASQREGHPPGMRDDQQTPLALPRQ